MSNLRAIRGPAPDALIADGLEAIAAQLRSGGMTAHRAVVILETREPDVDGVGAQVFGADASVAEIVGLCTIVQHHAINGQLNG